MGIGQTYTLSHTHEPGDAGVESEVELKGILTNRKNGKQYSVAGRCDYDTTLVRCHSIKDGKEFGPIRFMKANNFVEMLPDDLIDRFYAQAGAAK